MDPCVVLAQRFGGSAHTAGTAVFRVLSGNTHSPAHLRTIHNGSESLSIPENSKEEPVNVQGTYTGSSSFQIVRYKRSAPRLGEHEFLAAFVREAPDMHHTYPGLIDRWRTTTGSSPQKANRPARRPDENHTHSLGGRHSYKKKNTPKATK